MTEVVQAVLSRCRSLCKKSCYAQIFIAKIVLFALIYWGVFWVSPDAYNFVKGYNTNPLSAFWGELTELEDRNSPIYSDSSAALANFAKSGEELQVLYQMVISARARVDEASQVHDQQVKDQIVRMEHRIDEYEVQHIEPLTNRISDIENAVDDPIILPSKKIDLLQEQVVLLEQLGERLDYTINSRLDFLSVEDHVLENKLLEQIESANSEYRLMQERYREHFSKLSDQHVEARIILQSKIGFFDFLYFSACISTTTTFGDITPNLFLIRMIIVFQIFLGIIILALALSRLGVK